MRTRSAPTARPLGRVDDHKLRTRRRLHLRESAQLVENVAVLEVYREAVERWIKLCGFRRGAVRRVDEPDRIPSTVVAQLPLAGYPIRSKDIVELAVAE